MTAKQYVIRVDNMVGEDEDSTRRAEAETTVYEEFKSRCIASGWTEAKFDAYWNEVEEDLNTL